MVFCAGIRRCVGDIRLLCGSLDRDGEQAGAEDGVSSGFRGVAGGVSRPRGMLLDKT